MAPARPTRTRILVTRPGIVERMRARLTAEGLSLPDDAHLRRTYAGAVQRREGAWSWCAGPLLFPCGTTVGSHYPMTVLLGCDHLKLGRTSSSSGDTHVDPELSRCGFGASPAEAIADFMRLLRPDVPGIF